MTASGHGWTTLLDCELTLRDQSLDRYRRVPFTLPTGTASFEVRIEVEDPPNAEPPASIDLGCEGPDGWRGWSGGARRTFVLAADDATPGYVPGPLESGEWAVVLGLHALPAGRAVVRVLLRTPAGSAPDHGPRPAPKQGRRPGSARDLPTMPGRRWLAGDTHCHSLHSDGDRSLWQVAQEAVLSGLDFLCVTDHNTVSHHAWLPEVGAEHGITLVPGQEVTAHRGHANAYGDIDVVDFRRDITTWGEAVAEQGGLLSINHPVSGDCSWLESVPDEVGGIEVLHSDLYRDPLSTAAVGWTAQVLAARRDRGLPAPTLLAGGDFHAPDVPIRPGTPTTWVCAEENSPEAIVRALSEGCTALTASWFLDEEGVARPRLEDGPILVRTERELLHVLDGAGHVLVDAAGRRRVIESSAEEATAPREAGPYRLETSDRRTVAISA